MPKDIIYNDIDLQFLAHPVTGNVKLLTNTEAIKQAVINTVLLDQYESLFNPNNFTNTRATLFENFSASTVETLKSRIEIAVQVFEPRAEILEVLAKDDTDNNGINITIVFLPLNAVQPVEIEIFLERIR